MSNITKEQIIEAIEKMTVLELNELVKTLEEKFNVTAIATTVVAAGGAGATSAPAEEQEQTEFDVILKDPGEKKIPVIKIVKDITGLDLKAAKELVDSSPKAVKQKLTKEEAEDIKSKLEEQGAFVEIK